MHILNLAIHTDQDIVRARQRSREIAEFCGFARQDTVRIATAVSELARNTCQYAGGGNIRFSLSGGAIPQELTIHVWDNGPGIADLDMILSGHYRSKTGMGRGLLGVRRLMDDVDINTCLGEGTEILLRKTLPKDSSFITAAQVNHFCSNVFSTMCIDDPMKEVIEQNKELLNTLADLNDRKNDLIQLTQELEDTNRGVVALYAELDEKAEHLRRADAIKSRFLSNMSHEFRTPLSSIRVLTNLLLQRIDGDLSLEQEKQVSLILDSAMSLTEMVNDLLDIAKIESGKVDLNVSQFDVGELFSALRGMMRPLVNDSVALHFVQLDHPITMNSDEAKLGQILRNFISNAIKYTERGEIRVAVSLTPNSDEVIFSVRDTGLGIDSTHVELIFEEFSQIENPLQCRAKGTGLGLPLCRQLAALLHGSVAVESTLGEGSTFTLSLPINYQKKTNFAAHRDGGELKRFSILLLEDDETVIGSYQRFLSNTEFYLVVARTVREANLLWHSAMPAVVIMEVNLQQDNAWSWLADVKKDCARQHVPIIVVTTFRDEAKILTGGADLFFTKPLSQQTLISSLTELVCLPSVSLEGPNLQTHEL